MSQAGWIKALPNQLTMFRIAVVPLFIVLAPWDYEPLNYVSGFLLLMAAITDWLDGFIARSFNVESRLGAVLDPLADKLIIAAAFVVLAARYPAFSPLFSVLMVRELGVTGLRHVALEKGVTLSVNSFGKLKTFAIDTAIICLTVGGELFGWPWREVGFVSLVIGTGLSLYSAWLYWKIFIKEISF